MELREPSAKYLVQTGYQQTELGTLPVDWKVIRIGNLDPFVTSGSRGWARYYSEAGSTFLRITNLSRDTIYPDLSDLRFVSIPANDSEGERTKLVTGDVLISITADVGIVGYVSETVPTPAFVNQHIALIRFSSKTLDSKYLSYFLASSASQQALRALADAGAKAGMNLSTVLSVKAALPPTSEEQKAISDALTDADTLIESLEQLLAKKRKIKQGAMQDLLTGQRRLPGFSRASEHHQTDLGSIPSDWEAIPIAQIAQCLIGLTYSPTDVRSAGTLVLRSSNVQDSFLAFDDNVYVDMDLPPRVIAQEGDILICVRNGSRQLIGKCALIDANTAGSAFGAFMAVLRSTSSAFLFQQFQSAILKKQIAEVMGATINQITNKDMAAFKVIWPKTEDERTAIATILSDMDTEIAALETRLTKARQLKQGMAQALLTGRIRLV